MPDEGQTEEHQQHPRYERGGYDESEDAEQFDGRETFTAIGVVVQRVIDRMGRE